MLTRRGCAASSESGERVLDQAEGGDDVDLEGDAEVAQRVVGQRGAAARRPSVPALFTTRSRPPSPNAAAVSVVAVVGVGDVAGDGDHPGAGRGAGTDPAGGRPECRAGSRPSITSDQPAPPARSPAPARVPGMPLSRWPRSWLPTLPSGGSAPLGEYSKNSRFIPRTHSSRGPGLLTARSRSRPAAGQLDDVVTFQVNG